MGNAGWRGWTGRKGESATDGKDMEEKICEKAGWLGLTWKTVVV